MYRAVELSNGKFALQKCYKFLWWIIPTDQFRSTDIEYDFSIPIYVNQHCLFSTKEEVLKKLEEVESQQMFVKRIVSTSPLEKALK